MNPPATTLLIDSGNSRLKIGLRHADGGREDQPLAFDNLDFEALGRWLDSLPKRPAQAVGVNVAGAERGQAIADTLSSRGCAVHWQQSRREALGLHNHYDRPEQLGADRWAALLGVLARLPAQRPPVLLACFGTATTIDTIAPDNAFPGGLILPGPAMMRNALNRGTANLPFAEGAIADFPTNTVQAIASGIGAAQAGALVRQWLVAERRYGVAPEIYVAGGGWPEVREETERLLADAGAVAMPQVLAGPVLDGLAALVAHGAVQS